MTKPNILGTVLQGQAELLDQNARNRKSYWLYHEITNFKKRQMRENLVELLGGRCVSANCTYTGNDIRVLQIDHIQGGGLKELKQFKSRFSLYKYYLTHTDEAIEKLQILCTNCNWIKKYVNGERFNNEMPKERLALVNLFGNQCMNESCESGNPTDLRCLQLDHVKGHGVQESIQHGAMLTMYRYYLKHVAEALERLQVLCANCNMLKRQQLQEHPTARYALVQVPIKLSPDGEARMIAMQNLSAFYRRMSQE